MDRQCEHQVHKTMETKKLENGSKYAQIKEILKWIEATLKTKYPMYTSWLGEPQQIPQTGWLHRNVFFNSSGVYKAKVWLGLWLEIQV